MRTKFHDILLDGQSVQDTVGALGPGRVSQVQELALYVVFGAGTTAGAVVVESAHRDDYTGTWANLATVSWAAATRVHHVAVTGVHLALRVRISTTISGGTVDAFAVGN